MQLGRSEEKASQENVKHESSLSGPEQAGPEPPPVHVDLSALSCSPVRKERAPPQRRQTTPAERVSLQRFCCADPKGGRVTCSTVS